METNPWTGQPLPAGKMPGILINCECTAMKHNLSVVAIGAEPVINPIVQAQKGKSIKFCSQSNSMIILRGGTYLIKT